MKTNLIILGRYVADKICIKSIYNKCEIYFSVCYFIVSRLDYSNTITRFSAQKLTPPLFHSKSGLSPLDHIADVGINPSRNLKLISREIIFKVFQPVWTWTSQTDIGTDGRAVRTASRGKNGYNWTVVVIKSQNIILSLPNWISCQTVYTVTENLFC